MDTDQLLLLLVVCAGAYLAGYRGLAIGLAIITGLVALAGGTKKSRKYQTVAIGGVNVRGAEMLEPIIIESTRGAPFRIPSDMDMRINPKWSATNLIEKATQKGLAPFARLIHRMFYRGKSQ
ncbi:MAG: hypothetical protein J7L23_03340 [Candidatus Diapherotrites archaeon]|nr:hypothetical protein [Candidatus Diapherotrites archaeon]